MNKIKYYVVLMCLSLIGACIGPEEEIKYTEKFEEEGFNRGVSILPLENGFIILGYTSIQDKNEIWLLKIDKNEKEIWRKSYSVEKGYIPIDLLGTEDDYIVSGYIASDDKEPVAKIVLLKVDKQGEKEWQKYYAGLGYAIGGSILSVENGFILVGFTFASPENSGKVLIIKADREGNKQWQKIYGDGNQTGDIICKTDDGYLIGGSKLLGVGETDLWLTKIDKNGEKMWSKTYEKEGVEWGRSIFSLSDGFVIAGCSSQGYGSDFWLMKVDVDGNEVWLKTYDNEDDVPFDALKTEDSFVIVGWTSSGFEDQKDVLVIKTDREGNEKWQKIYGDEKDQIAYSVCEDNGGLLVIGMTRTKDEGDLFLIKIE